MNYETALFYGLILHFIGDYITQSDWMANEKTKAFIPAIIHALIYSLPFILIISNIWLVVFLVFFTHFLIDRFRLARFVCYIKNYLSPKDWWFPFEECKGTGYHKDRPPWLAVWLMIIADNTIHVIFNSLAIYLTYK